VVYEIIRVEGEGELARSFGELWWSAFAAGLSIGFSVLTQGMLKAYLPNTPGAAIVENLGYSVGFLIVTGWLIAALVWMLPSAEGTEIFVITLITYLIALGGFTHVVAGSAEAFYLWLAGPASLTQVVFGFLLPTLAGNLFGGTLLFAVLSYAQVREEIDEA
jgi:formate/nitrite transporter FocA (FNT family)